MIDDYLSQLSNPVSNKKLLSGQMKFQDVLTKPMQIEFGLKVDETDSYNMKLNIE